MTAGLKRSLDLGDAVVIGAGSMIGAGVFAAWAPAAAAAGDTAIIGLAIAGLVAFCNATSSAQLAALHPESGGSYVYGRRQLGDAWGHVAGWGFVVGKTASCAAMALTVGAYLWPAHQRTAAVLAVLFITTVNLGGLSRTVTVTKGLLAVSLISLGIVVGSGWTGSETSLDHIDLGEGDFAGTLRSAGFLFFAFAGYARIATLGEEVRDPQRTIPRAIPSALGAVLVLYLAVAITTFATTPAAVVAASDAPLRAVLDTVDSPLGPIVAVGAGIAALGVLLNLIPGVSRTVLAMARNRELPAPLAQLDPTRSLPLRAELTVTAVVVALVLTLDIRSSIAVSGVAVLLYYAVTNAAALTIAPGDRRFPRLLAVLGFIGCLTLIAALPPSALIGGGLVLLTGVVARAAGSTRQRW